MTWILVAIGLVGVVANIYHKRWCFHIWAFTNGAWMVIDFQYGIYSQSALFAIYLAFSLWGIFKWK